MKSVKPGRGPSFMGGIGGVIFSVFAVIWTISSAGMGAPGGFSLIGVLFVCMGAGIAIYNFVNATRKNRFSAFDITDGREEPDPLNERFGAGQDDSAYDTQIDAPDGWEDATDGEKAYCPWCGAAIKAEYAYCPQCGRRAE